MDSSAWNPFLQLFAKNLGHFCVALGVFGAVLVVLHTAERRVSRAIAHALGWHAVLLTGWLGVSLHELSHLLAARIFGHRVVAYSLFSPDPVTGTLGYVRHAYSKRSFWQLSGSFFVGIAPLVAGFLALMGLVLWMVPRAIVFDAFGESSTHPGNVWGLSAAVLEAIWSHRTHWLPLQLYLALCVASHMSPSRSDLKNGFFGGVLVVLVSVVLVAVLSLLDTSVAPLLLAAAPMVALAFVTLALQFSYLAVVRLLLRLGGRRQVVLAANR